MRLFTPLSLDEILLPRYKNCSTNFGGYSVEIRFKQLHLQEGLDHLSCLRQ